MDIVTSVIILILTFSALYFPLKLFLNLLKYKEAALGLIFTNLDESIFSFKIFAIAVLIFAIGRLLDVFNAIQPSFYVLIDNVTTLLYFTTDVLLIYAFYKLSVIADVGKDKKMEK
ncbi:MAG TPA: hypothetical protein VK444_05840 [Methanobacteriaceae archaeon]|nr:hypothetical protein [Methanobacteriaceae archaeon]